MRSIIVGVIGGFCLTAFGGLLAGLPLGLGFMFHILAADWSAPDAFPYGIYVVAWGTVVGAALGLFWLDAARELAGDA